MYLESVTIAVVKMNDMIKFYHSVFEIDFESREMYGSTLYFGKSKDFDILLCPAELAGNTSAQNRYQFHFVVKDLDHTLKIALASGGTLINPPTDMGNGREAGIYDPDKILWFSEN